MQVSTIKNGQSVRYEYSGYGQTFTSTKRVDHMIADNMLRAMSMKGKAREKRESRNDHHQYGHSSLNNMATAFALAGIR